jgi:hypothetical protein
MSKFLIRGYEYETLSPTNKEKKKRTKFPSKFNLAYIKEWFDELKDKESFLPTIDKILERRIKSDQKICQRFHKITN